MKRFTLLPAGLWLCIGLAAMLPARTRAQGLPLRLQNLDGFRPAPANWQIAGGVEADRNVEGSLRPATGAGVLVNLPTDQAGGNLFTAWEHGDLELALDFMMPKGSNSGIYLQGRYEVQLFDSWGVRNPTFSDCGGIYQRWDPGRAEGRRGYEGQPPRVNVSRAPGLWQHLEITFQAPRFDADGKKIADARFEKVTLNGVVIHENVAVTGPTRAAAFEDERPLGPLMLQGDHGPVAFRDIRYKIINEARVSLRDLRYRLYEGAFDGLPDLARLRPARQGVLDGLTWEVGGNPDTFAVAYDGVVRVPTAGTYRFDLQFDWITGDPHFQEKAIGGGVLRVGGQTVVRHDGRQRAESGRVDLAAGSHPFTLTYFKNRPWHVPSMALYVEGPDTPVHALNAPGSLPEPSSAGAVYVEAEREPVVLRSFVEHGGAKKTHAVSVGEPGGLHYSLDLDEGALLYVWKGPFVDATSMWSGRGQDQLALPRGSVLTLSGRPALAYLDAGDAPWPEAVDPSGYRFLGYDLDRDGRPAFRYRLGEVDVEDRLVPEDGGRVLRRTLTLHGGAEGSRLWCRVAAGREIARLPDGTYAVDDRTYYVDLAGEDDLGQVLRTTPDGRELVVPVRFDGRAATLSYVLIW